VGGIVKTGVTAHDSVCLAAEVTRQSATAGVASSAAGQAVVNAAEIAYARTCLASCKSNNGGQGQEPFIALLRSLGVNA
jgi:hypothetical protein